MVRAPARGRTTPIALAILFVLLSGVGSARAASVTIAWDPSPDETVIGYQVHVGTSPGTYTETFDVGLATSFSYNPRDASVYYFAVASYAAGPLLGPLSIEVSTASTSNDGVGAPTNVNQATTYWSSLWANRAEAMVRARSDGEHLTWTVIQSSRDRTPTVEITVPTPRNSYSTDQPFVTLSGRVIDDGVVTEVSWTTDRGYNGRATGTENWIAGVPLQRGKNTITIRALDDEGKGSSRNIVVNLAPRRW
jgi:hypothetical protein